MNNQSSVLSPQSSVLNRILVAKLAGIGDLLTAFPALEALRRCHARAEIVALVTPQTESLLQGSGLVDRVMVLDKYLYDEAGGFLKLRSAAELIRLGRRLRQDSFDAAVLLHHMVTWAGVLKYALLMISSGARLRVGLQDGRAPFLNLSVRDGGFGARHEVEYWLEVVGLLGATSLRPQLRLNWGPEEELYAAEVWSRLGLSAGDRVVAIHPGTGSYSPVRRWSPQGFVAVAEELAREGLRPMVVAGPGEEPLARQVAGGTQTHSVVLKGVPTPRHLAAVLSRCRLFVGNDGGVMHLAAASGVPVVAVFGPSNPRAWGPYDPTGERARVVRVDLPCSPCLYRGQSLGLRYGCGDLRCMLQVTPAMVTEAALSLLGHGSDAA